MEPKRAIEDVIEFDEKMKKITDGLIIIPGSLFLLPHDIMQRWGIEVTDENRTEMMRLCEEARITEMSKGNAFPLLERFARPPMREWIEPRMARYMGDIVKELALSFDEMYEEIHICDMPSRDGLTSGSIALQMDERLLKKSKFHLVDTSNESLNEASENMKRRGAGGSANLMLDSLFMKQQAESSFDIIVSLSHLHHISFLHEYLLEVHRILRDGGVFVMGDRHSAMFDSPFHTADLLERMGAEDKTIRAFRKHIGLRRVEPDPHVRITEEEQNAIGNH